jgi:hypothetical protein
MIGSADTDPCSIAATTWDDLAMPLPICPTLGTVSSSKHIPSPYGIAVTLGCDVPVAGVSGGSVYAAVTVGATTVVSCPMTIMNTFCTPASYCPPTDVIAAVDGTCPISVVALADGRRAAWRVMLFFGASARGS